MQRLTPTVILALLALAAAASPAGRASRPARQCPVIKVSCSSEPVPTGAEASFSAEVTGRGATFKPSFKWEVSAGSIVSGDGTTSIKVDTTGLGNQAVTATIEVEGLSPVCERTASCTIGVAGPVIGCRFDEYGNIKFDDEKARLDNFAIELQNDPTAQGYLTCYGGRRGYEGEALRRCGRAKEYLSGVRGIEPERVVTVDGGFREELTVRLVIVPSGATPPVPTPTVDRGEVEFIMPPTKRRAPRH